MVQILTTNIYISSVILVTDEVASITTVSSDKLHKLLMCDALQAQVVLAFEQSLTNMTQRLQRLAVTANEKVSGLSAAITLSGGYGILLVLLIC